MIARIQQHLATRTWARNPWYYRLSLLSVGPLLMFVLSQALFVDGWSLDPSRQGSYERGQVLANILAPDAEEALQTGSFTAQKQRFHRILEKDRSLYRIDIIDVSGNVRLSVPATDGRVIGLERYQARVLKTLPLTDPVSNAAEPPQKIYRVDSIEMLGEVIVVASDSYVVERLWPKLLTEIVILSTCLAFGLWAAVRFATPIHGRTHAVMRVLHDVRDKLYPVLIDPIGRGNDEELLRTLKIMSESLMAAKQELESKVLDRTRDLEASRNRALKADAEKRRLIQQLNTVAEDERKSIAIEVHDEMNGALLGARFSSRRILDSLADLPNCSATEAIRDSASSILRLTSDLYASARSIVRRLRPESLDVLGLDGAIEEMLQTYAFVPSAPTFNMRCSGELRRIDGALAITAYRLVQECISNVIKHARASEVLVIASADGPDCNGELLLSVADNGVGFQTDTVQSGIGLIGIRERVCAYHGTVNIQSHPGQGTTITILLHLDINGIQVSSLHNR